MYEAILIPTDGSDAAAAATDDAVAIAERFDATVHALYVVETDVIGHLFETEAFSEGTLEKYPDLHEQATAALDDVDAACEAVGVDCVRAIDGGIPHRVIENYVDDHDIDLVVMGTHGRSGVSRALLGSVTDRVIRMVDVPVLAVDVRETDIES